MKKRVLAFGLLLVVLVSLFPAALADYEIVIDTNARMDSEGKVTIRWRDPDDNSVYVVYYQYVNDKASVVQHALKEYAFSDSVTLDRLIPGASYRIIEVSTSGTGDAVINVPSRGTVESKRKVNIEVIPKYRVGEEGEAKNLKTMSASAMERNMAKGYQYGIDYQTTYLSSGSEVKHEGAVFALYAPNGYVWSAGGTLTIPAMDAKKGAKRASYGFFGEKFFSGLLEANGSIPTGTYKLEIYLEGRFYRSATFNVVK